MYIFIKSICTCENYFFNSCVTVTHLFGSIAITSVSDGRVRYLKTSSIIFWLAVAVSANIDLSDNILHVISRSRNSGRKSSPLKIDIQNMTLNTQE